MSWTRTLPPARRSCDHLVIGTLSDTTSWFIGACILSVLYLITISNFAATTLPHHMGFVLFAHTFSKGLNSALSGQESPLDN